ncbi:MAG: hypothetical protein WCO75_03220, partial [Planctomycetota bacterium]
MKLDDMNPRKRIVRKSLGICLGMALGAIATAVTEAAAQQPPHVDPAISGSRDGWRREGRNRSAPPPIQGQGAIPRPPAG